MELSPRGEIEVDSRGQTSVPGVLAGGDATTTPYKQIVIAMAEGSRAAHEAVSIAGDLRPAGQPAQVEVEARPGRILEITGDDPASWPGDEAG